MDIAPLDRVRHPVVCQGRTLRQWPHIYQAGADRVETVRRNDVVRETLPDGGAACRICSCGEGVVYSVRYDAPEIPAADLRHRNANHLCIAEDFPVAFVICKEERAALQ